MNTVVHLIEVRLMTKTREFQRVILSKCFMSFFHCPYSVIYLQPKVTLLFSLPKISILVLILTK